MGLILYCIISEEILKRNNLINKEPDLYRKLAKKLQWEKNERIEPSWLEEGLAKIGNRYHQQLMHNEIKTAQIYIRKNR